MTESPCAESDRVIVAIDDVRFRYKPDEELLEGVTLTISEKDFLGILGPNGSGKTTLLKMILGLLEPQEGKVTVLGGTPQEARSRIGYVPQVAHIDADVPADVLDVVLLGRLRGGAWGPSYHRRDIEAARAALDQTGTLDLARRSWKGLSGGQRQRVLIARALAAEAEFLLLDEPTSGVDLHREKELLSLLRKLNDDLPIALVTHDLTLVSSHLDRAAWLHRRAQCFPASELSLEKIELLFHCQGHGDT